MKTLFLAWQDAAATRQWFPIGRLDANPAANDYAFEYIHGAELAHQKAGLEPLDAFPDFTEKYRASELFPLFKNRVVTPERLDFAEYLRQLDIDPKNADPLEILAVSGGTRQTDSLEVFPKIHRNVDGGFHCKFLLHGWRHVNTAAQERLATLQA
ncbi:MAG: DNA-binding protein, partial [Chthoniobacterales bacterium]